MASFMCDLVKLVDKVIGEARHVFCFTSIVKEFEEERVTLEPAKRTMEQRIEVSKGRGKDIIARVPIWEKKVDDLFQLDTKTKQKCCFEFCPNCIWRYKKGKELVNNLELIKQLKEEEKTLVNIDLPSFSSREAEYKALILDALKDDNNYIIGLQGMGGTGKTTLAKEAGKELKQSKQFSCVVDTTVSFTPNIKKIQDEIGGSLGLQWKDCNESDRRKKLWSRLTNGEKILLIIDDVWEQDPPLDFDEIGIPKQDNHKGCRVLVTSRSKQVLIKMDCDKIIELDVLSEDDAWLMFERYADISSNTPIDLIGYGRLILKECKQLPIAIAITASILKGQHEVHEWKVTLQSLRKIESIHGVDEHMFGIYKCLKVSYDYIKDEKAKRLFLICSLFREGEEISIEVLTRLCIGAGVFEVDNGSYDDARNQAFVAKNILVNSCLLLQVDEERVKMHSLVYDFAQWIANREIQCINLSNKRQKLLVEKEKNMKYLLCEGKGIDLFSYKFDGSKLEILIVVVDGEYEDRTSMEVPDWFFENIVNLQVLYFVGADYPQPLSLPNSIQRLTNIRSMSFDGFDLGDISTLGNLQSVETLDLVQCTINEFPSEIRKLEKLKLLKLEDCEIRMKNPFEVIKSCSSLEELYFINSFNDYCQEINIPEVQRYHIQRGWVQMNDSLSKSVIFHADDANYFSKEMVTYCAQTSEFLWLSGIEGTWRNLIPDTVPTNLGMNDVVELYLSGISHLRCLVDTIVGSQVPNVLSKLVVLKLKKMDNLEELFNAPLSFESLKNLEKLSIKDSKHLRSLSKYKLNLCNLKTIKLQSCPMLVSLFESLTSPSLVLQEKLQIANCEGMENIISDERREEESREEINDGDDNDNMSRGSMFSKLKVIDIKECPRLQYILPFLSTQGPKNLEKLSIKGCKHLQSLSKCKLNLCNLKTIKLQNCPMLVSLCQLLNSRSLVLLEKLQIANCEGLENIISDERRDEESIEEIDDGDDNNDNKSHGSMFPMLKVLHIEECPRLQYILPFLSTQGLLLLEEITIIRCDELKYIFGQYHSMFSYRLHIWEHVQCLPIQSSSMCNIKEINLSHFSKMKSVFILSTTPRMLLETLTVTNCDELKNIIIDTVDQDSGGNNWGDVFPKLKRINVGDCNQLEYIFGHSSHNHQNHNEVHLHLPTLEHINLCNLPRLVAMSTKQYRTTFPPSAELEHYGCSQDAIKSFHGFVTQPISKYQVYGYGQITTEDVDLEGSQETTIEDDDRVSKSSLSSIASHLPSEGFPNGTEVQTTSGHELPSSCENGIVSNNYEIVETEMNATTEGKQEFLVNIPGLVLPEVENSQVIVETKMKQTAEANQEFVVNVSGLEILEVPNSPTNSKDDDWDGQISIPSKITMIEPVAAQYVVDVEEDWDETSYALKLEKLRQFDYDLQNERDLETTEDVAAEVEVQATSGHMLQLCLPFQKDSDGQITTPSPPIATIEPLTPQNIDVENWNENISLNDDAVMRASSAIEEQFPNEDEIIVSKSRFSSVASQFPSKGFPYATEVQATSGHGLTSSHENDIDSNIPGFETKMKQTAEGDHDFIENVSDLKIASTSIANSECLKETEDESIEEASTSETRNEPFIQLVADLKQKGIKLSVEDKTTLLPNAKTITSSPEYGDGKIAMPFSISTTVEPLTIEDVDIEGSQETTQTNNQDFDLYLHMESVYRQFQQETKGNENSSAQTTKEFAAWIEAEIASRHELVSLQDLLNEQPTDHRCLINPQHSLGEIDITVKPCQENNLESSTSEKTSATTLSTTSETKNEPPIQLDVASKQKEFPLFSLYSNVEQQSPKKVEITVSPPSIASQCASKPSEEDSSHIVEDLSYSLLVKRELEQLVFKKHLAIENLSLLTDFLVKHPSVLLRDTSLSNRYKGYAYNCLSELLKFLQTHSVLDVLGPSHSEFVELLHDVRKCGFDKEWLDDVEKRTLFPGLQVYQDRLKKLLDSKDMLTQHVEDLKHQLASTETVLESIIQQEEQILEAQAALSDPIGY